MKYLQVFLVFTALLFAGVVTPPRARAEVDVSFDYFYDSLAPYGEWIEVGDYGLCWRPANVDPNWEPYADGYWAYTDAGWTWVSYEEFGGIVYHYGRWIRLEDDTWCWRPDYEWAPAWVSWRSNDDYVGWAPLPPEARWRRDVGISVWVDRDCDIGPGYYHFCHVRDFGEPVLRGVIINRQENVVILRQTVNITNITYNTTYVGGPVIFNGGPRFETVNRFSARPLPTLKLVQNTNFDPGHWRDHRGPGGRPGFQAQTVGNQLIVAAPVVRPPSDPSAFRSRVKVVVNNDKVSKGWGVVKNPEVQKEIRQEINRQSKGLTPESAPAKAVAATDLKVVPVKADPHATPPATATTNGPGEPRDRGDRGGKGPRPGANGVVSQPNNVPPTAGPATATTTTPEPRDRGDRGGKGPRPGSGGVVTQPNNVPPNAPAVTTVPSTPSSSPEAGGRERGRGKGSPGSNPPTAGNPTLKPFNAPDNEPRQPQNNPPATTTLPPQPPTRGSKSADTNDAQRAADDARKRAEQDRMNQQRQAEAAAQQQRQSEAAMQQKRQAEAEKQQRQAEAAAQQKQRQADMAVQQQRQAEAAAQQQRQSEDARRAADQQKRAQQQQQMQNQQQQQRDKDARRAQDADRDRQRQQQQQRPPQPQPQSQPQGNPPAGQPHQGGGHSKDGKDKDKDKDKDKGQ